MFKILKVCFCVIFSFLLIVVAVLPAFAVSTNDDLDFSIGGGGGFGSGFRGVKAPVQIYMNYYTTRSVDNSTKWLYATTTIDPCFNTSVEVYDSNFSKFDTFYGGMYYYEDDFVLDTMTYDITHTYHSYANSVSNIDNPYLFNWYYCGFDCLISNPDPINNISFYVPECYAWSEPFGDTDACAPFRLNLFTDSNFNIWYNDWAFLEFDYNYTGEDYLFDGPIHVRLPLSDFVVDGVLSIDLGIFFDELSYVDKYYYVTDLYVNIPCELRNWTEISGELYYYYNWWTDDPGDFYPLVPKPMEPVDYTEWITQSVMSFFELQIFPGFYLSGFLLIIVAFAFIMWFLKLLAGG